MTVEEKAKRIKSLVEHSQELFEALKTVEIPSGFGTTVREGLKAGIVKQIADIVKE